MTRQTLYASLVLLGVFFAGSVAGGGLVRYLSVRAMLARVEQPYSEPARQEFVAMLRRRLGLSGEQAERIEVILKEQAPEQRALRLRVEPEASALRRRTALRIRGVLAAEQQVEFDQYFKRYEGKLQRWLDEK